MTFYNGNIVTSVWTTETKQKYVFKHLFLNTSVLLYNILKLDERFSKCDECIP